MQFDYFKAIKFKNLPSETTPSVIKEPLPCEVLLQISINDVPYTITMRSPGEEEALIRGLLYTEKIYQTKPLTLSVKAFDEKGNVLHINVTIDPSQLLKKIELRRNLPAVSSCGLCGNTQLSDVDSSEEKLLDDFQFEIQNVPKLFIEMTAQQHLFAKTGATHAAALFLDDRQQISVCEDIGRHNAVDKVIGKALMANLLPQAKVLAVSGRVSYEIIQKAVIAKIPIILAVSAPTALAVQIAEKSGITLVGFCRQHKATVYSSFNRIKENPSKGAHDVR